MGIEPPWRQKIKEDNRAHYERSRKQASMTPICPKCNQPMASAALRCACGYSATGRGQCHAERADGLRCQRPKADSRFYDNCGHHSGAPALSDETWTDRLFPGWEDQP